MMVWDMNAWLYDGHGRDIRGSGIGLGNLAALVVAIEELVEDA